MAHFLQPTGPSKPGADWIVELNDGSKEYRVIVRTYSEDVMGLSMEQQAVAVAGFVGALIQQGWTPLQWKGTAGELTLKRIPAED